MLRTEAGDASEILDKINSVQPKWKRLFQNLTPGLVIETHNPGHRGRKLFLFSILGVVLLGELFHFITSRTGIGALGSLCCGCPPWL